MNAAIDIDALIQEASDLAPLSTTAVRLSRLLGEVNYHLDDVVELISFDQSLTLKLLRAANSAAHGRVHSIGTVEKAVQQIGAAQVLALTIASNVQALLFSSIPAYNLFEGGLWRHSVAAATCVETIHSCTKLSIPPEAFTAALLHDVGKLVLGRHLGAEIIKFLQAARQAEEVSEIDAEALLLDVNHAELGGLIAQHWNLPDLVVLGITYHHNPEKVLHPISDITYAANRLAKQLEAEVENREVNITFLPEVMARLDLTPDLMKTIRAQAITRFAEVKARYNSV